MDPLFVLPLIMGVTMYVQQMLNPQPTDPMQAKVFKLMPVVFTVFLLFFPSGLVLYWIINNLLTILQQWLVNRSIAKEAANRVKTAS
jgi:YidC/Oxa1 family membrane protein insertase